jgi:hypothetical protein
VAPVEAPGEVADAHDEFTALQTGSFIIHAGCQDIRQIEPGFETGETLSLFREERIRPGFSPKECVTAVHCASFFVRVHKPREHCPLTLPCSVTLRNQSEDTVDNR